MMTITASLACSNWDPSIERDRSRAMMTSLRSGDIVPTYHGLKQQYVFLDRGSSLELPLGLFRPWSWIKRATFPSFHCRKHIHESFRCSQVLELEAWNVVEVFFCCCVKVVLLQQNYRRRSVPVRIFVQQITATVRRHLHEDNDVI